MRIAKAIQQGKKAKVKVLQWLLTHSRAAKLLAVKRVSQSSGANTPGVDGEVWRTSRQKVVAAFKLYRRGYKASPVRRVYIPKSNGNLRPLGIPTMQDRAMQALYLLALEPVAESLLDKNAYGFRPYRSTADAIAQCSNCLARKNSAQWILEGDIKACFDNIDHQWFYDHIMLDKVVLRKWLEAGAIDQKRFVPSLKGTQQGGVISPTLANLAMCGLEDAAKLDTSSKDKVNVVIYADDFIVTASSEEVLQDKVMPNVVSFFKERGLELSKEKTKISYIDDGFDFLGFNVRKYKGTLLIKPSKKAVKGFLRKAKEIITSCNGLDTATLLARLNPVIRGWSNYYKHAVSKDIFYKVDNAIYRMLIVWINRRHPNKNAKWKKQQYFRSNGKRHWVFHAKTVDKNGEAAVIDLIKAGDTPITRYIKIRSGANPYDPQYNEYFEHRKKTKAKYSETVGKPGGVKAALVEA